MLVYLLLIGCTGCQTGIYADKVVPALNNISAPNDVWELGLKIKGLYDKESERRFRKADLIAMQQAVVSGSNIWVHTPDLTKVQGYQLSEQQPIENDRVWMLLQHSTRDPEGALPSIILIPESLMRLRLWFDTGEIPNSLTNSLPK